MSQKLVLDLDALTEAPQVRIDGQLYNLRTKDEFAPIDAHRFKRLGSKLDALVQKEDLTEAEEQELQDVLDRLCQDVIDAPIEVLARLRDAQKMRILQSFISSLTEESQPAGETEEAPPKPEEPALRVIPEGQIPPKTGDAS